MTEPIRRSRSENQPAPSDSCDIDVLLIAEESRGAGKTSGSRPQSVEPLDMETVVRKLIAFWIAKGTGRVEPVDEMDPATEARLRAIGYF